MMSAVRQAQTKNTRRFLIAGFLALGLLVFTTAAFAVRERTGAAAVQAALSHQNQLTELLFTVEQAESGQRGYLLTGDPNYLNAYHAAAASLPRQVAALAGGTSNASGLALVDALMRAKMNELAKTIALYHAGQQVASLALVRTDLGLQDMNRLHDLIAQMRAAEASRLSRDQTAEEHNSLWLLGATLLGVLGTLLLAWFAIRDSERQTERLIVMDAELTRIFNLSTDILAVGDLEGNMINVSPAWETVTGWPMRAALDRKFIEFIHPDDRAATEAVLEKFHKGLTVAGFENRCRRADGSYCWLSWRVVPLLEEGRVYKIARDITQDKIREEQLWQSQKMEVVGQLTGGIAHDFNNLLTIILGSLELLQRGLKNADDKTTRRIDAAMDGARRAATLTHRLLAYARRQPLQPQALDPNKMLSGMSELLHRVLDERIELEFVPASGLWRVMADGHQLENAILNLTVNARDAMPAGGHLTLETQNMYLDDAYAAAAADVQPGQYVMIAVTDTGIGMAPEIRAKVFEPFFTTKPTGQGTGLGLAQVYGFIKQSSGHIKIYSEPGHGTTVKLYLPRLRGTAQEAPHPAISGRHMDLASSGETILVVEDEESVRNFAVEVLQDYGYSVIAAENASAALKIIESRPSVNLVFTDVVLTGDMNGRQMADILARQLPGTPILFTTGYTRNAIIHHGRLDDGINFLGKPFTATALAQTVRKILDAPAAK